MSRRDDIVCAIRCCRGEACAECPLQTEICDELYTEVEELPVKLVDLVLREMDGGGRQVQ